MLKGDFATIFTTIIVAHYHGSQRNKIYEYEEIYSFGKRNSIY